MSFKKNTRLGYACLNTTLAENGIFTSRAIKLDTLSKLIDKNNGSIEEAIKLLQYLSLKNLQDLLTILVWNESKGIRLFRISSNILVHYGSLPFANLLQNKKKYSKEKAIEITKYDLSQMIEICKQIGSFAKKYNHRLTSHPGQYNRISSPNDDILLSSLLDLEKHAIIFKMMKLKSPSSIIILHGGGIYESKEETIKRFIKRFFKIPKWIRKYIALENDENVYNVDDILDLCEKLKIPFVLDIFHNNISNRFVRINYYIIERFINSWNGEIPKVHYSEQNIKKKRGSHSKSVDILPNLILNFTKKYNCDLDIMLEVKDKEMSLLHLLDKYFTEYKNDDYSVDWKLKKKYR